MWQSVIPDVKKSEVQVSVQITCLVAGASEDKNENRLWTATQMVAQPWIKKGAIKLTHVSVQTEEKLRLALADGCDVLHLITCGKERGKAHYATVTLRSMDGNPREFTAQAFARLLLSYPKLRLVILQASDSNTKNLGVFGSVLGETGSRAVLVTQCLLGGLQEKFLAELYSGLSECRPLSEIVQRFRKNLVAYGFDSEAVSLLDSDPELAAFTVPNVESEHSMSSATLPNNVIAKDGCRVRDVAPPAVFFSYSHVDETLRNRLEVQLSSLKRQGLIAAWHDRLISAGNEFGQVIDDKLESSKIILLLVSPNFIASDYCYELEMSRALEKHARGEAHVLPIILRPCDWRELPFGKLLAIPKDGRPITSWPDADEAFLDVVRSIKHVLREI